MLKSNNNTYFWIYFLIFIYFIINALFYNLNCWLIFSKYLRKFAYNLRLQFLFDIKDFFFFRESILRIVEVLILVIYLKNIIISLLTIEKSVLIYQLSFLNISCFYLSLKIILIFLKYVLILTQILILIYFFKAWYHLSIV